LIGAIIACVWFEAGGGCVVISVGDDRLKSPVFVENWPAQGEFIASCQAAACF
jgi:hypothetical protein